MNDPKGPYACRSVSSCFRRYLYHESRPEEELVAEATCNMLSARIAELESEVERLRRYCGDEPVRSDFRTATEMRSAYELQRALAEQWQRYAMDYWKLTDECETLKGDVSGANRALDEARAANDAAEKEASK